MDKNVTIKDIYTKLRNDLLFDCVRKADNSGVEMVNKNEPVVNDLSISVGLAHSFNNISSLTDKNLPQAVLTFNRSIFIEARGAYWYWVRNIYELHVFIDLQKKTSGFDAACKIDEIRNAVKWSIQGWKPKAKTAPMYIYGSYKDFVGNEMLVLTMQIAHEDLESYKGTSQEIQDCELIDEWKIKLDMENYDKKAVIPKPPGTFTGNRGA